MLTDLGVKYAIYNIPLSHIVGETTNEAIPTILYEYKGEVYKFNGASINGYDDLFSYLTQAGMNSTAIILNDWNDNCIELIHPMARNKEAGANYYAINTAEKAGCEYLEAIASFLTERYSGREHGLVSNWVIANEINQYKMWNYIETQDIEFYSYEYEKAMRIFYNAADAYGLCSVYHRNLKMDEAYRSAGGVQPTGGHCPDGPCLSCHDAAAFSDAHQGGIASGERGGGDL